nr:MAG TPA: hypothetical protein [Caudoviricetes sp.]
MVETDTIRDTLQLVVGVKRKRIINASGVINL